MGLIKFEVEIPEFKQELNINLTIRKDGEVIENLSTPTRSDTTPPEKKPKTRSGGNMMNMDL